MDRLFVVTLSFVVRECAKVKVVTMLLKSSSHARHRILSNTHLLEGDHIGLKRQNFMNMRSKRINIPSANRDSIVFMLVLNANNVFVKSFFPGGRETTIASVFVQIHVCAAIAATTPT